MKNFLLTKGRRHGVRWLLLHLRPSDPGKTEYLPFTQWVKWAEHTKGYSNHTIDQYAGHLARFIDFTVEACNHKAPDNEISHLANLYHSFLLHGKDSENQIVVELATVLGKDKKTSPISISRGIEASIVSFFNFQIAKSSILSNDDTLLKYFMSQSSQSERELAKIKEKSWLAGCIKGSLERSFTNKTQTKIFAKARRKRGKKEQAIGSWCKLGFKLENIDALVNYMPSRITPTFHRDMALYMLLGATGGRSHECLQLRLDDVNLEEREIKLVSPFDTNVPGLTEGEYEKLSWKGRETSKTFMIEPFASAFWLHFEAYISTRFRTNTSHPFVFQKMDGRPYFTADRADRIKRFKATQEAIGIPKDKCLPPHSLRHLYGTYLLNYIPIGDDKYGLPMAYVKILMGHASIESTEKYAQQDTDLLDMYIELSNKTIKDRNIDLYDLRIKYIDKEIKKLEILRNKEVRHV